MECVWRRDSHYPALENLVRILQGNFVPALAGQQL